MSSSKTAPAGLALTSSERGNTTHPAIDRLARRMLSPLSGLSQSVGFILRGSGEPRFVISGAQLTGVHVLLGRARAATYHIGGAGLFRDEATIRSLGETVERYAQLVAPATGRFTTRWTTFAQLENEGEQALPNPAMNFFSADQYGDSTFPYRPLEPTDSLTWIRATSLLEDKTVWVPAQLLFIGYQLRGGEPWLSSAITTGSAAHTDPNLALRSALLEMIQLDGAMGHWYSGSTAPRILPDTRTRALDSLLASRMDGTVYTPTFHWLAVPGFDVRTVACVMRGDADVGLGVAVGLGTDSRLDVAMYKAALEASATVQLAKMLTISPNLVMGSVEGISSDRSRMLDLDSNVAHYARPEHRRQIDEQFPLDQTVRASDLPPDDDSSTTEHLQSLFDQLRDSGARVTMTDCTSPDAADLGFVVPRVWSPDLLLLCLPSVPPTAHPRFERYGGVRHTEPHPYA